MPGPERTSRDTWTIAIGGTALPAVGVGVAIHTGILSLRTPDPTDEDLVPRDWDDDITPDEVGLLNRLLFCRYRGKITIEVVDDLSDGTSMDDNTGHQPIGGANGTVMDEWLDEIVEQSSGSGSA